MGTASARSVPPWALISCWTRRSASRKGSDRIMDIGIPPVGVLVWFCRGRLGGWSTAAARLTGVVAADRRRWPIVSGIGAHRSQSLQGGALGVVGMEGQDHLHGGHQVPRGPAWHPAPRDPDPGARGRAGGYGYGCRPVGQRGGDRRAQCGFSHSQGQAQHQVTTLPGEPAVLLKADPGAAQAPQVWAGRAPDPPQVAQTRLIEMEPDWRRRPPSPPHSPQGPPERRPEPAQSPHTAGWGSRTRAVVPVTDSTSETDRSTSKSSAHVPGPEEGSTAGPSAVPAQRRTGMVTPPLGTPERYRS